MNVDIGRDRKRTANITRSEVIRERIEDHLMRSGGKNSRERYIAVREDFVNAALRTAERAGLRCWKGDDKHRVRHSAMQSLRILFGEYSVTTSGKNGSGAVKRSGVNAGWVLDLWEATLDHLTREDDLTRRAEREAEVAAGNTKGGYDEPEDGVRVFNIAKDAPISTRLLDAYLNRDDEAIMRIAVELEHQENGNS